MTLSATDAELTAWWASGDWSRLDPVISIRVRELLPRLGTIKDEVDNIVSDVINQCWALEYVPESPLRFIAGCVRNRAAWRSETPPYIPRARTARGMAAPDLAAPIDCSFPLGAVNYCRKAPKLPEPFVHCCRCGNPACTLVSRGIS